MRVAKGSSAAADPDRLRYVARFDADLFAAIAGFAESRGLSFNRAISILATRGLSASRREAASTVTHADVTLPSG
jgi:hypothetical protein